MRIIDSHLHLSDYPNREGIISFSKATALKLYACSTDEQTSKKSIMIARQNPGLVFAFVGLHPSEAEKVRGVGWLAEAVANADGVGEIGLDPKYSDLARGSAQRVVFSEQLSVAERTGKPVQVHSRNAEATCIDELASHRIRPVLLHWFNGETLLGRAEELGYYVSFGPALVESRKLQRMAARYPPDLILTESDGPVPFPSLGGSDGPFTVPSVLFKLAEVRGVSIEEMADLVASNASVFLPRLGKVKPTNGSGLDRKFG